MDVPSSANPWLELVAKVGTVLTAAYLVFVRIRRRLHRRADEREQRLIDALVQRTQPIQPEYRNGGESLADLAHEQRRTNDKIETLTEQMAVLSVAILGTDSRLTAHIASITPKE